MATATKEFTIKRAGRTGEEIDFNKYFDGQVWTLSASKDFKMKVATFRQRAAKEAKARGGELESRVDGDKGLIQICYTKGKK